MPAALEPDRPAVDVFAILRPRLALEGRQHACLGERGLAHPGIAEKNRKTVWIGGDRRKDLDRFVLAAKEVVAVLLLHCFEAAIGRGVAPELAGVAAAA